MKKTYISPMTTVAITNLQVIMAAVSNPGKAEFEVNGGKDEGPTGTIDKVDGDESDAKHNTFNVWDED